MKTQPSIKLTPSQEKMKAVLKPIVEGILKERDYYRLDKKTIGNDLYGVIKDLKSIYDTVNNGNDFKPDDLNSVIKVLQTILSKAEKFDSGTMPINKDFRP